MKVVEIEKTIKEVQGYTAYDGTFFRDKEECEKYEKTADTIIKGRFRKLILNEFIEDDFYDGSPFRFFGGGYDDITIARVKLNSKEDVDTANMYLKSATTDWNCNRFTDDMIGKEIYVMTECCGEDRGWIYGDEQTLIDNVRLLLSFCNGDEEFRKEMKEKYKDLYKFEK